MIETYTELNHIALQYDDKEKARIFFSEILKCKLEKSFTVSSDLSENIFSIKQEVKVQVYSNEDTRFEIFISENVNDPGYSHICINVVDIDDFIRRCKKYDLEPFFVKKGNKKLLFVRDYCNNLFEVKKK